MKMPPPANETHLAEMLAGIEHMKRVETSITTSRVLPGRDVHAVRFWRDGLGDWSGFSILRGTQRIIVAQSEHQPEFAASLWYSPSVTLRGAVSLLIDHLDTGPAPKFMTSEGTPITFRAKQGATGQIKVSSYRLGRPGNVKKIAV